MGIGFKKCNFSRPPLHHDETGVLEQPEVLRYGDARHGEPLSQRTQGLTVGDEQGVQQVTPGRIREGLEHQFHGASIGNHLVTYQGVRRELLIEADVGGGAPGVTRR